jgi:hypothetical protein
MWGWGLESVVVLPALRKANRNFGSPDVQKFIQKSVTDCAFRVTEMSKTITAKGIKEHQWQKES